MIYKKLYFLLFNAITDALEQIKIGGIAAAEEVLISAQQRAEALYVAEDGED